MGSQAVLESAAGANAQTTTGGDSLPGGAAGGVNGQTVRTAAPSTPTRLYWDIHPPTAMIFTALLMSVILAFALVGLRNDRVELRRKCSSSNLSPETQLALHEKLISWADRSARKRLESALKNAGDIAKELQGAPVSAPPAPKEGRS